MIAAPVCGSYPELSKIAPFAALTEPASLRMVHGSLGRELHELLETDGISGAAARDEARVLRAHFQKEEECVFPLMALLSALPGGRALPEAEEVQIMSCRLLAELPPMFDDHRRIVDSLNGLAEASGIDDRGRMAGFADRFYLHARTEEEVHYPAALLVGEAFNGRSIDFRSLRRYYRRV